MNTQFDWLGELAAIEEIFRGIVTYGECPDWVLASVNAEVRQRAAMCFARRLSDPATRGGQKAIAGALQEVRAYCIEDATGYVRRIGGDLPTPEQIAEYDKRGRDQSVAAQKRVDALLADVRAKEAAA